MFADVYVFVTVDRESTPDAWAVPTVLVPAVFAHDRESTPPEVALARLDITPGLDPEGQLDECLRADPRNHAALLDAEWTAGWAPRQAVDFVTGEPGAPTADPRVRPGVIAGSIAGIVPPGETWWWVWCWDDHRWLLARNRHDLEHARAGSGQVQVWAHRDWARIPAGLGAPTPANR